MGIEKRTKLNNLERDLPEGLVVDAAWLEAHGYSAQLRKKYASSGWLKKLAHTLYQRPRGTLGWEQVVVSLQMLLKQPFVVGGRTALDVQGYSHYLAAHPSMIHLYGPVKPPAWLNALKLDVQFVTHNSQRLLPVEVSPSQTLNDIVDLPWGQWKWPMKVSTSERAILELLDELPVHETFHQVDKLFEGLTELGPRRMQALLEACRSIKVKRLFFFFADRHNHAWMKRLDKSRVDLGRGKRKLVEGGKLDPTYNITVPGNIDAL